MGYEFRRNYCNAAVGVVATAALLRRRCVRRARQMYGREAKCRAQSCNGTVPCHVVAHRGNAVLQAIEHVAYIRLLVGLPPLS
jgi:glutamate racemase